MLAKLRFASSAATAAATRRVGPSAAASSRVTLMAVRWNQQAPVESHIFDEHDGLRRPVLDPLRRDADEQLLPALEFFHTPSASKVKDFFLFYSIDRQI